MPARGRGGKRSSERNANAAAKAPPAKKTRDAGTQGTPPRDEEHMGTGHDASGQAPHAAASASGAPHAAGQGGALATEGSSSATTSNSSSATGWKDGTPLVEWSKGTSSMEWDHKPPQTLDTPEHLAIVCPPATQQLIWEGSYVNLACFIPKEEGEELTTRIEWSVADGVMKQHSTPRQVR